MPIIAELKTIYPSLIISDPEETDHSDAYAWYLTPSMETIGILKEETEARDTELLSVFLTPAPVGLPAETERETAWNDFLKGSQDQLPIQWPIQYRFVFFSIANLPEDKESFQEAFQSLFPRKMPIIWDTSGEGFIIEEIHEKNQEPLSFQGIVDVLMSDFYTNIQFYISEFSQDIPSSPSIYKWAAYCHTIALKYRIDSAVTYKEVMPYLFIEAIPEHQWEHIHRSIFQDIKKDKDLLQTIKVFLQSGSNATLAAKTLYMHRNSLQYRVDKFIEKTGIDVKQFEGAMITYLALLTLDQ
ncbi:PucR C-terminal helix-turn-helix domain-containing protein [Halobacillus alkaliphilus]|uniref:PucR C-terminal helix-turn-helix domain-containing protein n=1 Tax=Halobacillus alkaliphilus TaxID=396056 RepID=A0A1I2T175_9BACI|nr:helix-turn-helix domain-containing protein [Halobacillus alkaliphilus]SFG58772.1 PucR C-terminal helix-turn-helix domain-containing protein [Halobacillus alkaliphilus]